MSLFRKTPSFLAADAALNAIERVLLQGLGERGIPSSSYPTSKSVARKKKSQFCLN